MTCTASPSGNSPRDYRPNPQSLERSSTPWPRPVAAGTEAAGTEAAVYTVAGYQRQFIDPAEADNHEFIAAARQQDEDAWNWLVQRYQPIINSVCRQYRLDHEDAADVGQTVWLKATENLGRLRNPQALPGWIKTTAVRAACAVWRSREHSISRDHAASDAAAWSAPTATEIDDRILHEERRAAVRDGLAQLSEDNRALLTMLSADPPLSYQSISDRLGIPIGSIGPTRARSLRKLAATSPVRALSAESIEQGFAADAA